MLEPERVTRALRELRSLTREVATNDPESFAQLVKIRDEFDQLVREAATAQVATGGYSWGALAKVLGITRQSTHARYKVREENAGGDYLAHRRAIAES